MLFPDHCTRSPDRCLCAHIVYLFSVVCLGSFIKCLKLWQTNDGQVYWRIHASLCLNELKWVKTRWTPPHLFQPPITKPQLFLFSLSRVPQKTQCGLFKIFYKICLVVGDVESDDVIRNGRRDLTRSHRILLDAKSSIIGKDLGNELLSIISLIRHKKTRFDSNMHSSTQWCQFQHQNALTSMHQLTLPSSNTTPTHPSLLKLFSILIKTFRFKEPTHELKWNYHCQNCGAADPGGQARVPQCTQQELLDLS